MSQKRHHGLTCLSMGIENGTLRTGPCGGSVATGAGAGPGGDGSRLAPLLGSLGVRRPGRRRVDGLR